VIALAPVAEGLVLLALAAGGVAVLTPVAIRVATQIGFVDAPAARKFHRRPTPYLGGLAVAGAVLVILGVSIVVRPEVRWELLAIAVGGLAVAVVGLRDDWSPIRPLPRLLVQAAAACVLWVGGIRIGATGIVAADLAITVFAVMAVTNAVNLLDNMDGVSTGAVAVASLFFFGIAVAQGQLLVAPMAAVLAGACLGFLPYNFHPARIFLGDAGALFLGFLLATLAIKLELPGSPTAVRVAVPLLVLGVPLFDMVLVVVSRYRAHRPVFQGATDHSAHRLVSLGLTPRGAFLVIQAACLSCGVAAILVLGANMATLAWAALGAGALIAAVLLWVLESVQAPRPAPTASFPRAALEAGTFRQQT
jgi:UDP-GlcNAc:undecaprenyl-phosphate/decaprenyl-phosphate GlcNAc-1-phosphate transferase